MAGKSLNITKAENSEIRIEGELNLYTYGEAERLLKKLAGADSVIDISAVTRLDTAGALLIKSFANDGAKLKGVKKEHEALFKLVADAPTELPPRPKHRSPIVQVVERLGKGTLKISHDTFEIISFFGQACVSLLGAIVNPRKMRLGAVVNHIEHIGINAIPIVSLMAFLISVVLAYQGIAQLRPLGAEQFTVNLIALSVLREMGVLLTAIMVAGRSGSSFTAEIGVMKVREEIDAMRAIGLDPFEILVVPRLLALIIALPLLAFIANIMGLLGGAVLSSILIDIPFVDFFERVHRLANVNNAFFVGMVKAPVFAIAIGVVGCLHGMKVTGSSESVGRETTASVVKSIFVVLMLDALFSIFFERIHI